MDVKMEDEDIVVILLVNIFPSFKNFVIRVKKFYGLIPIIKFIKYFVLYLVKVLTLKNKSIK